MAFIRLSWVTVNGITYKPGEIVVLKVDLLPQFGLIINVIAMDVFNFYLVCEVLITHFFNSHFHSYQVSREDHPDFITSKVTNIADYYYLSYYKLSSYPNFYFVPLKYYLVDQ